MVVVRTRKTAATWADLETDFREFAGDNLSQRYTSTQVQRFLRYSAEEIWNILGYDPAANLTEASMTYTADADAVDLPEAVASAPLMAVVDATNSRSRKPVRIVSPSELERYETTDDSPEADTYSDRVCAIIGNQLAVRPVPAASLSLTLRYVAAFYTPTAGAGDQHPYPINHEELLVLGAVIRAQETDSQAPPSRVARHQRMLDQLRETGSRNIGSTGVVNARRVRF